MNQFLSDSAILIYESVSGLILLFFIILSGRKIKKLRKEQEMQAEQQQMDSLRMQLGNHRR